MRHRFHLSPPFVKHICFKWSYLELNLANFTEQKFGKKVVYTKLLIFRYRVTIYYIPWAISIGIGLRMTWCIIFPNQKYHLKVTPNSKSKLVFNGVVVLPCRILCGIFFGTPLNFKFPKKFFRSHDKFVRSHAAKISGSDRNWSWLVRNISWLVSWSVCLSKKNMKAITKSFLSFEAW